MSLDDPADTPDGENDGAARGGGRRQRGVSIPAPMQRPQRESRPGGGGEHRHGNQHAPGFRQYAKHLQNARSLR